MSNPTHKAPLRSHREPKRARSGYLPLLSNKSIHATMWPAKAELYNRIKFLAELCWILAAPSLLDSTKTIKEK